MCAQRLIYPKGIRLNSESVTMADPYLFEFYFFKNQKTPKGRLKNNLLCRVLT